MQNLEKKYLAMAMMFLTILMSNIITTTQAVNNYNITDFNVEPSPLTQNTDLVITVIFSDITDIERVRLHVCQLSPNFVCEAPVVMTNDGMSFVGSFFVEYDVGTVLGYKIDVRFTNETLIFAPDRLDFLELESIVEPVPGEFYIQIEVQDSGTQKTTYISMIAVGTVLVMGLIIKKRKR